MDVEQEVFVVDRGTIIVEPIADSVFVTENGDLVTCTYEGQHIDFGYLIGRKLTLIGRIKYWDDEVYVHAEDILVEHEDCLESLISKCKAYTYF